jgi:hypothetical protein
MHLKPADDLHRGITLVLLHRILHEQQVLQLIIRLEKIKIYEGKAYFCSGLFRGMYKTKEVCRKSGISEAISYN